MVKYRRHRLVFAKTNMKPAAAGEPRSPPGGRTRGTLTSRAWVLPRPRSNGRCPAPSGPPIKDSAETPRRGACRRRNVALGTARRGCISSRAAATVTLSPRRLAGFARRQTILPRRAWPNKKTHRVSMPRGGSFRVSIENYYSTVSRTTRRSRLLCGFSAVATSFAPTPEPRSWREISLPLPNLIPSR